MSYTNEITMNSENEEDPIRFRGNCFLVLAKQALLLKIVRYAQAKCIKVEDLTVEETRRAILV